MEFQNISTKLRALIKAKNLSYKEIAAKLDMSESGVKKLLTAEDISFNKLNRILALLGIDIDELIALREAKSPKLSEQQEDFLSVNLGHYHFFIQFQHFESDLDLLKSENPQINKSKLQTYIDDLKKIGLLVVRGNKLRSAFEGGFEASKKLDIDFNRRAHAIMQQASLNPQKVKRTS